VPVSEGTNTLVVTVEDVGGNVSTQSVTFTRQSLGGTQPFVYDDNGNLVERSVWSNGVVTTLAYDYDMENRLTRVTRDEETILECWYDAAGRRIAKREVVGSETNAVQYVWEGWALLAVLDESGNLLESYTRGVGVAYDVGSLVAVHHHDGAYTNQTFYLHNNHRGDVTTVRSGANTVATYRYSAYGAVRQQAGNYASRLGFSSKELDASVGLLYFGFRFYDPTSGKWLTPDPIGQSGGLNAYRAFDSNPIVFIDALGLFCGGKWLDRLQTGLDAAGLLPGVGIVPDAGNTIISLLRGNWGAAGLSALAMVPALGQIATVGKYGDNIAGVVKRWPSSVDEMDGFLGFPGRRIPDTSITPGRNKHVWNPSENIEITFEQHPYHPTAPPPHKDPHWHLDIPGKPHQRFLPGDPIPGYF
jgi:RHS repeat-associated protein